MKTINDVMSLMQEAIKQNDENKHWFINFSGHVNQIEVRLYPNGWSSFVETGVEPVMFDARCYLDNAESVQEFYYWVLFKIKNK